MDPLHIILPEDATCSLAPTRSNVLQSPRDSSTTPCRTRVLFQATQKRSLPQKKRVFVIFFIEQQQKFAKINATIGERAIAFKIAKKEKPLDSGAADAVQVE